MAYHLIGQEGERDKLLQTIGVFEPQTARLLEDIAVNRPGYVRLPAITGVAVAADPAGELIQPLPGSPAMLPPVPLRGAPKLRLAAFLDVRNGAIQVSAVPDAAHAQAPISCAPVNISSQTIQHYWYVDCDHLDGVDSIHLSIAARRGPPRSSSATTIRCFPSSVRDHEHPDRQAVLRRARGRRGRAGDPFRLGQSGPEGRRVRAAAAAWLGVEHAVATNSCTSAMQIALHLSGVGRGDEVICPSFTCMASANAILQVGAVPSFVDIDPRTFNMDPRAVAGAVTARTRAILAVHQIGLPADLDALGAIATSAGVAIVEDAGCALGAAYQQRRIGAAGHPACFSLHPRKTITTGEGGVLTTGDAEFAERARAYRSHGASVSALERHLAGGLLYGRYHDIGHNFRFTDIQAAIGLVQLEKIDEILRRKSEVAARYSAALSAWPSALAPVVPDDCRHAWQSYLVTLTAQCPVERDAVIQEMAAHGVSCLRGIAPLHHEPVFAGRDGTRVLPHTDAAYRRTIFLPIFAAMTAVEVDYVMTHFARAIGATR